MCISQERHICLQDPETTQAVWGWRCMASSSGPSVSTSLLLSLEMGWGTSSCCTAASGYSDFNTNRLRAWGKVAASNPSQTCLPRSHLLCLTPSPHLFLIPHPLRVPATGPWLASDLVCRLENCSPVQVSVVATFITHERAREPPLSVEALVFIYLFIDFATAHPGAQGDSVVWPSLWALLERAVQSSNLIKQTWNVLFSIFLRWAQHQPKMHIQLFLVAHTYIALKHYW